MTSRAHRHLPNAGVAVIAIAIAALVGGLVGCTSGADPEPQFSADDGLPSGLVAGQGYRASITVTLPADWPGPDETGRVASVGLFLDLGTGDGALICDSQGLQPADLPAVTLTCGFTPKAPTLGVRLVVAASPVTGPSVEHEYAHTVAP